MTYNVFGGTLDLLYLSVKSVVLRCQMKAVVSASSNYTSSLTSGGQSTYMGQQQLSSAMYGSSLQQHTVNVGATGAGGRASQYQYYSNQSQQPAVSAAQQHLPQYYTSSQVLLSPY